MRRQNPRDFPQFGFAKTLVPAQLHRIQPKFRFATGLDHVNVNRFIGFGTVKTDAITFLAQHRWHWVILNRHRRFRKRPIPNPPRRHEGSRPARRGGIKDGELNRLNRTTKQPRNKGLMKDFNFVVLLLIKIMKVKSSKPFPPRILQN
jgi:hypothetical protein